MPQDGEQILLREEVPMLDLVFNNTSEPQYGNNKLDGWRDVSPSSAGSNNRFWAYQSELDVSGWGVKGLTFYPSGFAVQQHPVIALMDGSLQQVITLISQNPFDIDAFVQANVDRIDYMLPGLLPKRGANVDRQFEVLGFEDILGGKAETYANSASIMPSRTGLSVAAAEFGSLEPTATDRLYITRLCFANNLAPQTVGIIKIPSARVILAGIAAAENQLSYIYRLKNSFKLAQTDVGLLED